MCPYALVVTIETPLLCGWLAALQQFFQNMNRLRRNAVEPLIGKAMMCSRILVPYDHPYQLQVKLIEALPLAARLAADVVLLRVNLPECPETGAVDWEQLFSELKGLQSQMPPSNVRIVMETRPGPPEQAIFDYASENEVSLILSPHLTVTPVRRAAALA